MLVVDDEQDMVNSLLAVLRNEGYEARGHQSGQSALQALREFTPDVVVSDIAMPGVNGWELAREVRKRMGRQPTLIALTGRFTQTSAKVLAQICGFNHYVIKSSDPKLLLELIAKSKDDKQPLS
ncbi:MAG TPA: response regulator [Burkholderiales bacterium]|nr:response regulator [Burkholderiales bacterium]